MNKLNRPADHEADLTYNKAAKAELARDYDLAFRSYLKSAELFLHLSRSGTGPQAQAAKWKAHAGKALQRAEKIKAFVDKQKLAALGPGGAAAPTSADPDGQPKLSPEQAKVSPVWSRVPVPETGLSRWDDANITILPQEILQHIVTDCSVCASISVLTNINHVSAPPKLARAKVHQIRVSSSDRETPAPASGRYDIKIMFNGDWRRVSLSAYRKYIHSNA
ncbi:hypothetical protein DXG03_004027 [Asterophora parasitica]|uniref:Calpain catalytic domain-containing protein n=1 Tax=Asterophora parasitica TaxID=117018 RepID=A0A9P7KFU2_9AGAR|nr:hypothetical protein DXG03_004027 [Asterophora parasitica]